MGIFSTVPKPKVKRSRFHKSVSFENKLTLDFGMIVPILAKDMLPGDNFYYQPEVFMRALPMVAPMMQLCDVHIDVFKIPMRLLMRDTPQIPGFETFMSPKDVFEKGVQPDMTQFELTFGSNFISTDQWLAPGSLSDYLGLPTINKVSDVDFDGQVMKFRALDHIAYQWVHDEFYICEDVQSPVLDLDTDFLSDVITDRDKIDKLMQLHYRNWSKDYFTSALLNTQRGIDVGIPITADVPISYNSPTPAEIIDGEVTHLVGISNNPDYPPAGNPLVVGLAAPGDGRNYIVDDAGNTFDVDNSSRLTGHLSNVVATINDLRLSVALQAWAEASMRGGARYPEILMSTFGVRPRDARLDRPECMGRISFPLQISEVLQTSETSKTSPQGNMSGRALAYGKGRYVHVYAEEHCLLHAYLSIMPRASYCQGMPKRYTKMDKFDYYWPQFDALGEQPILNRELYYDFNTDWNSENDGADNGDTFGYQQRYCEYKAFPNEIHGDFKLSGLNSWHMGRIFDSRPGLNEYFVNYEPELDSINQRIFASGSATRSHILAQVFNRIRAKRPMSYQVVPHLKG